MGTNLEYDKTHRTIVRRNVGVLIKHPKLVVNWHYPIVMWKVRRYPTLTACMFGPIEIVWPRRGHVLPESAA